MKIIVLNGSPKGKHSITLQSVNFLQKKRPDIEFEIVHVAQRIKRLEKDEHSFSEVIEAVRSADAVLWSFGLWVLVVSAQLMRFIELISERAVVDAFHNKYTAAMSTSIHYFDHTAHNFIRGVCEDLGMRYVDGLSLDILDLMSKEMRDRLEIFADDLVRATSSGAITSTLFRPLSYSEYDYQPTPPETRISTDRQELVVLTDRYDRGSNLGKMIDRFRESFVEEIETIDLRDIDIKGACIGCMKCGYDYTCQNQDGFAEFYNGRVRTADILVFAGEMKGRYLSSMWKTFYDRAFFWNHTPSLTGKQMAHLISGPLSQNSNLIQILEASVVARQNANHVDIVSDESEDSARIDAQLQGLAERLIRFSKKGYVKPQSFLGVGGHKVFRDNVWGRLRPVWQADHRHYRRHGFYSNIKTFPSKRFGSLIEKVTRH